MSFQNTYNDYWVETRTTEGSAVISSLRVPVDANELFQALRHLRSYFQDSQDMNELDP
jgi:hypothetical protein